MKRNILIVLIIIISLILIVFVIDRLSNRPCDSSAVEVSIGSSERFSQEEMESAFEFVLANLPNSRDAIVTHLWYDPDLSNFWLENTSWDIYEENIIILTSIVEVRRTGPGWMSQGTWDDIAWILEKDRENNVWVLLRMGPLLF